MDKDTFEKLLIAAAVLGVVAAVTLWMLTQHEDEASAVFRLAVGKATKWLD